MKIQFYALALSCLALLACSSTPKEATVTSAPISRSMSSIPNYTAEQIFNEHLDLLKKSDKELEKNMNSCQYGSAEPFSKLRVCFASAHLLNIPKQVRKMYVQALDSNKETCVYGRALVSVAVNSDNQEVENSTNFDQRMLTSRDSSAAVMKAKGWMPASQSYDVDSFVEAIHILQGYAWQVGHRAREDYNEDDARKASDEVLKIYAQHGLKIGTLLSTFVFTAPSEEISSRWMETYTSVDGHILFSPQAFFSDALHNSAAPFTALPGYLTTSSVNKNKTFLNDLTRFCKKLLALDAKLGYLSPEDLQRCNDLGRSRERFLLAATSDAGTSALWELHAANLKTQIPTCRR